MKAEKPQSVYRSDYRPPDYWIDDVELHFDLHEEESQVRARLTLRLRTTGTPAGHSRHFVSASQALMQTAEWHTDGGACGSGEVDYKEHIYNTI